MEILGWAIIIGLNLGLILAAVWLRRRVRPRKALGRFSLACSVPLFGYMILGVVAGWRALHTEGIDPSQKARLLAEAISEAINTIALGVVGFLLPTLVSLVLFLRSPKDTSSSSS